MKKRFCILKAYCFKFLHHVLCVLKLIETSIDDLKLNIIFIYLLLHFIIIDHHGPLVYLCRFCGGAAAS